MARKSRKAAGKRLARISKCAWKKAKKAGKFRYVGKKGHKRKSPLAKHYAACK